MAPPIVKRFLISLNQNKWLGIFVILASLGGAVVFAIQPPPAPPKPVYKAIGSLTLQAAPPTFTSTGSALQEQSRTLNKDILLSPWVLQRVAEKLNMTPEQIIKIRDEKITITFPIQDKKNPGSNTQAITLEYVEEESPTRAILVLETLMQQMIDYSRWLNSSQLRNRIAALQTRLSQVQKDLTAAEERFYKYISQQGSDLLQIQDGSLFSAITSSQQRQREIKLALEEINGQIANLTNQLGLTPEQAYTSAAFSADPIIADLRANILNIELQLERLKQDLRPEHPTIVKLTKEKEVNEILLQQRATELIGDSKVLTPLPGKIRQESSLDPARQQLASQLLALDTQREGLLQQLESLTKTEQELREQYEKFPDKQLQQARLIQAVNFQRGIYETILANLTDAQAAEAETVSSLIIAQDPYVPPQQAYKASKKNIPLIMIAGAGIGVLLAGGVIFLLAVVDDRLHSPQEIRDALSDREVLLLGQLPLIESNQPNQSRSPILQEGDNVYLAFYERFRSNIRRFGSSSSKIVIITSITADEGKTVSAYNLAIASAYAGKRTLLVEADLRSPSQATSLQVPPDPDAMVEPLRYYAARTESISLVPAVENLYILPSPGPHRQAAALIESSELQLLLKDARGRFDMVVIDTPSLSKCNDALLLEPLSDGIILVTRPGVTRSSLLNEALDQLIEAEVSVMGAIINSIENLVTTGTTNLEQMINETEFAPVQETVESKENMEVEVG
jgi:capsular exopolysaccharide synthesis family protein